mmetsp:Transcript_4883/g.5293  ORF Transcript_4883/g.5293 Transcript_4883/m.5293 type:complete len:222 (+) Transcript_4883:42-707(+)
MRLLLVLALSLVAFVASKPCCTYNPVTDTCSDNTCSTLGGAFPTVCKLMKKDLGGGVFEKRCACVVTNQALVFQTCAPNSAAAGCNDISCQARMQAAGYFDGQCWLTSVGCQCIICDDKPCCEIQPTGACVDNSCRRRGRVAGVPTRCMRINRGTVTAPRPDCICVPRNQALRESTCAIPAILPCADLNCLARLNAIGFPDPEGCTRNNSLNPKCLCSVCD